MNTGTSKPILKKSTPILTLLIITLTILFFACQSPVDNETTDQEVIVTFNSNGGSAVQSQLLNMNSHVIEPKDPVKEGFTFAGWFEDDSLTSRWEFTTSFATKDMTLYAKWITESTTVTITFNTNGGDSIPTQTVEVGDKITKPQNSSKSSYVFAGWFTDKELKTEWNFTSDTASQDITLFAKWAKEDNTEYLTNRSNDSLVLFTIVNSNQYLKERVNTSLPLEEWATGTEILYDTLLFSISDSGFIDQLCIHYILDSIPLEISKLSHLKKLQLGHNNLTKIPVELAELSELEVLNLRFNSVTELPEEMCNSAMLQELWLYDNQLSSLPSNINALTNLRVLELDKNPITTIPNELYDLRNLEGLHLYKVPLSFEANDLNRLTKLTYLNMGSDSLTQIPDEIWELKNLEKLYISGKEIPSLSAKIQNLTKLQSLNITSASIQTIPAEIGNLSQLKSLSINDCKLDSLPSTIGNLVNLTYLSIFRNNLTTLPEEITKLTVESKGFGVSYNNLKSENLSPTVLNWLNTFDPDWKETQGVD